MRSLLTRQSTRDPRRGNARVASASHSSVEGGSPRSDRSDRSHRSLRSLRASPASLPEPPRWRSSESVSRGAYRLLSKGPSRAGYSSIAEEDDSVRGNAARVLRGFPFQICIGLSIVANAWVIGMETDMPTLWFWNFVEFLFLVIFTGELTLRIFVIGAEGFFDTTTTEFPWNIFDLAIVSVGVLDFFGSAIGAGRQDKGMTFFRLVRLLRILRVLKIVRFLKQLYMLAYGFVEAMKAVFWVTVLMLGVLYMCSVVLVRTVGRHKTTSDMEVKLEEKFGSIPEAMLTLFQIMSQPNLMEYYPLFGDFPLFVVFLIGFIIFGSFGMIALLTGVISESMFEKNVLWIEEERSVKDLRRKLLGEQCLKLFDALDEKAVNADGQASKEVLATLIPKVADLFEKHLVFFTEHDLDGILDLIDVNGSGMIRKEEFCSVVLSIAEEVRAMSVIRILYAVARNHDATEECRHLLSKLNSQIGHQHREPQKQRQHYDEQPLHDAQSSAASASQQRVIEQLQGLSGSLGSVVRVQSELFSQGQSLSAVGSSILQRLGDIDLQIAQARDLQVAQARDQQQQLLFAQRGGGDDMQRVTAQLQQVSSNLGSSLGSVSRLQDELLNQSKSLARVADTLSLRLDGLDSRAANTRDSQPADARDNLQSAHRNGIDQLVGTGLREDILSQSKSLTLILQRLGDLDVKVAQTAGAQQADVQRGMPTAAGLQAGVREDLLSQSRSLTLILQRLGDLDAKIAQTTGAQQAVARQGIIAESGLQKDGLTQSKSLDLILKQLNELGLQLAEERVQRQDAQKDVIEQLQAGDDSLQKVMSSLSSVSGSQVKLLNESRYLTKASDMILHRLGDVELTKSPVPSRSVSKESHPKLEQECGWGSSVSSPTSAGSPPLHAIQSREGLGSQAGKAQADQQRGRGALFSSPGPGTGGVPPRRSTPTPGLQGDRGSSPVGAPVYAVQSRMGLDSPPSPAPLGQGHKGGRRGAVSVAVTNRDGDSAVSLFSSKVDRRKKGMLALGDLLGDMREVMETEGPAAVRAFSPKRHASEEAPVKAKQDSDSNSGSGSGSSSEDISTRRPYYDDAVISAEGGKKPTTQRRFNTSEHIMMQMFGERLKKMEEMLSARSDSK